MTKANEICPNCGKKFKFESVLRKHLYSCGEKPEEDQANPKPSPLTEYYAAFDSLRRAIEAIKPEVTAGDISHPQVQYYEVISRFVGVDTESTDIASGYGTQNSERAEFLLSEYRDAYGDGYKVTDFRCISVIQVEPEIQNKLPSEHQLTPLTTPVSPDTGTPVPVLVDSREQLKRALAILSQFPDRPATATVENRRQSRFPVEEIHRHLLGEDLHQIEIDNNWAAASHNTTAAVAAEESHFRRFALLHTGDESAVSSSVVVAFGIEFPSGAVVVEWLDSNNANLEATQNGLSVKPGPDGIADLRNVELENEYSEIVFIEPELN